MTTRENMPGAGVQTMAELTAGPVAPVGLSADARAEAIRLTTEAVDALDSVSSQIEAMRVAVLQLLPTSEQAATLPEDARQALAAVRVLLDQSLRLQSNSLGDWVGCHLDDLASLLKGAAA